MVSDSSPPVVAPVKRLAMPVFCEYRATPPLEVPIHTSSASTEIAVTLPSGSPSIAGVMVGSTERLERDGHRCGDPPVRVPWAGRPAGSGMRRRQGRFQFVKSQLGRLNPYLVEAAPRDVGPAEGAGLSAAHPVNRPEDGPAGRALPPSPRPRSEWRRRVCGWERAWSRKNRARNGSETSAACAASSSASGRCLLPGVWMRNRAHHSQSVGVVTSRRTQPSPPPAPRPGPTSGRTPRMRPAGRSRPA